MNSQSTPMASPETRAAEPKARETLSELVARILHQLSISAWLPGASLIFILMIEENMSRIDPKSIRHHHFIDYVAAAITAIGRMRAGSVVLIVVGIVTVTLITQAFEYEAIQLFEGYWGSGPFLGGIAGIMSSHHRRRSDDLQKKMDELRLLALTYARPRMIAGGVSDTTASIIETGQPPPGLSASEVESELELVARTDWHEYGRLTDVRRLERMDVRLQNYPEQHRILPTRLGNILRAYEDRVHDPQDRLQRLIPLIFDELPTAVQSEHDQYRNALALYCSLVVVFMLGGLIGIYLLPKMSFKIVSAAIEVVLATLSYRAAMATARHYGQALLMINDYEGWSASEPS